jgi:hypothetical protein
MGGGESRGWDAEVAGFANALRKTTIDGPAAAAAAADTAAPLRLGGVPVRSCSYAVLEWWR